MSAEGRAGLAPWRGGPREAIRRRHFPNVALVTHEGREVRFYDDLLRNRVVMLNFMYLQCGGSCPLATHKLAQVQGLLHARGERELRLYSITLNPEVDLPDALAAYAREHGAGPGWYFLRGAPADTERLRRSLGFVDRTPEVDAQRSAHVNMVRFGSEPRLLWSQISLQADPEAIASAVVSVLSPRRRGGHAA